MNNPLRTRDLGGFEMDTLLKFLSGTNFNKDAQDLYYEKDKKSLMPDFTYSVLSPNDEDFTKSIDSLEDFQNDGTQFPLLVDHFGQGTAIEQVLTTMPEKIPGVVTWSIGHNINPMFPGDPLYQIIWQTTHASLRDLQVFNTHDFHREIVWPYLNKDDQRCIVQHHFTVIYETSNLETNI